MSMGIYSKRQQGLGKTCRPLESSCAWNTIAPEDVMSPNGTHPRLKVKEPRSGRNEHRHAARLKCGLSLRLAKKPLWLRMSAATRRSCVARAVFLPDAD